MKAKYYFDRFAPSNMSLFVRFDPILPYTLASVRLEPGGLYMSGVGFNKRVDFVCSGTGHDSSKNRAFGVFTIVDLAPSNMSLLAWSGPITFVGVTGELVHLDWLPSQRCLLFQMLVREVAFVLVRGWSDSFLMVAFLLWTRAFGRDLDSYTDFSRFN